MAEIALGRVDDGGLGWSPSEFWGATVYDLERSMELSRRRAGRTTKDEAEQLEMALRDQQHQEAEERAAVGDTRTRQQVVRDLAAKLMNQGKP